MLAISLCHLKLLWQYKENDQNKDLRAAIKHHTEEQEVYQQEPSARLIHKRLLLSRYLKWADLDQVSQLVQEEWPIVQVNLEDHLQARGQQQGLLE